MNRPNRWLSAGTLALIFLACNFPGALQTQPTTAIASAAARPGVSPAVTPAATAPVAVSSVTAVQSIATANPAPATSIPTGAPAADNPLPPNQPVRLVFIHHSTGGNWLADPAGNGLGGDLGRLLMENNYYVSATNYGWGPDAIGDNTDIGHWWDWFNGPSANTYLAALYAENDQNVGDYGDWPRLDTNPGGENQVILFKSCFPNSNLGGSPADPPTTGDNPMRSQASGDDTMYTVGNAKGIYVDLLTYFATRQDKLFVVITAPPLVQADTDAAHAANARALNDWLVNDWLAAYPYKNVAVFDFYNVLTSNAGNADHSDLDAPGGNHHRWWNGAVQHLRNVNNNFSAYLSDDPSHPSQAGNQKAAAEFVPLLNVFYNRWIDSLRPLGAERIYLPLVT